MSVHNDIDGKESSKRAQARILIRSGLIMAWIAFIVSCTLSIIAMIKHGEFEAIPTDLIYVQLGSGLGALGFTLGERWNKNK